MEIYFSSLAQKARGHEKTEWAHAKEEWGNIPMGGLWRGAFSIMLLATTKSKGEGI